MLYLCYFIASLKQTSRQLLSPLNRWGNWGPGWLGNVPRVIWLVHGIWELNRHCLSPKLVHLTMPLCPPTRRIWTYITFVGRFVPQLFFFICLQPPLGHSGSRGGSRGAGKHLWFSCSKHGRLGQAAGRRSLALGKWQELIRAKENQTINWLEPLRSHQPKFDKID